MRHWSCHDRRQSDSAAQPSDSGLLFPVADRGYDRLRVELRVAELVQQLSEARRRGDLAEQALSQLRLAILTPRVPGSSAPGRGRAGAGPHPGDGHRSAERLRAQADREARALIAKAQQDAEVAWQNAVVLQHRLLRAEAEALATHHQRLVEQLGRLYAPLGLLVVDAVDHDQDASNGGGLQSNEQP